MTKKEEFLLKLRDNNVCQSQSCILGVLSAAILKVGQTNIGSN